MKKQRTIPAKQSDDEKVEILLVEDTESDARRTLDALREGKVRNRVVWVQDGQQAIDFLHKEGTFAEAARPDLILLDWHLPKISGADVLAHIKEDPHLKRIPVVIMTGSREERAVLEAYDRHANCFVNKPMDVREFINVVRSIEDFWLTVVRLPAA
ncbi:MAG: response regulator [Planctomycetes bacterium]|nr:response regulator [Planctomycetota bacterium]